MEQLSFGYWLKLKRKALDLTREALAERVGYSAATLRKIEDEERRPSVEVAQRLADVFHIPPGERESFLHFARGDSTTAPTATTEDVPWRASTKVHRSNIPATTTSLIARQHEIAQVREYLSQDDIRLVTLIGPPGIGKTRLSIETARASLADFPDGVFFVALAPLEDATLIAMTIAQALGYIGAKNISTIEQLKDGIGEKQMLIVLDNCEHLIEDVASLASNLLSACFRLKVLTTSRESLRVAGEWLYPVPPFDVPAKSSAVSMETAGNFPALILFAERARAVQPDFALTEENIQTISAICAHLDGLPLVIELIAARMRVMSPRALLERMNDQFILTANGMRAASARQKTLNHAIGWSYNLLSVEERKLFACLSVFAGGFTLEAAEMLFSVMAFEKSVPDLITLLLDKSLLQHVPDRVGGIAPASGGIYDNPTYTMLVTIQEFARERLREMGEETESRNKHLLYYGDLARQADQNLRGPDQLEWLRRLDSMRDNLRAALSWAIETGQTEIALELARNLHWFWFVRGDHTEGRQWLGRVLEMPAAPSYHEMQAEILTQLAHHFFIQVGNNEQRPFIEKALLLARSHNDKHNTARALAMLGLNLTEEKNYTAATSALEESQALYQAVQDEWGYAYAVMCLASSLTEQDLELALTLQQQALSVFRKLGDRFFMCVTLRGIAIVHILRNHPTSAVTALREALMLAQQLESKLEIAGTFSWWGDAERDAGNFRRAVVMYLAAKNLFDLIGGWPSRFDFDLEKDLAPCREALGELAFMEAVDQGRTMTMEQAIAYALENDIS